MKIKTSTILFFTVRDLDEAIAFYKKIPDVKPVTFAMNERRLQLTPQRRTSIRVPHYF